MLRKFQIVPRTLISFCLTLEDHYHRSVPYHNNVHAADVTQSINCLLNTQALEVGRRQITVPLKKFRVRTDGVQGNQMHCDVSCTLEVPNLDFQPIPPISKF